MKTLFLRIFLFLPFFGAAQNDTAIVVEPLVDSAVSVKDDAIPEEGDQKVKKTLTGTASFYAAKFEGRRTANGEIFSNRKMTAACNVLPLGTWIRVTNLRNGKVVIVKTNDRLHPKMTRIVDLTKLAAEKLGFVQQGLTKVKVEVLGKNYKK